MAAVSQSFLARSFRVLIVFLVLHLLDSDHPTIASVLAAEAPVPVPAPISIAFETDGSIFDEGYVTPANIVNGAYRTDLIVSTASADTIVIIANDKTCDKPNIFALSCFPETLGTSVVGMDMSMPQGPVFEWNEDSLALYARGNSANSSIQLSNPGSLETSVKVDSLRIYYTTPAESNITYGLLGLGRQSTLLRYLTSQRLITSNAYGLYLGTKLKSIGPGGYRYSTPNLNFPGSLVLGGYDKRQFGGQIIGGKLSDTNFPRLEVSNIVLHNEYKSGEWPQSTETITVDVDSTTPDFHLPDALVTRLAYDIGAEMDNTSYYEYISWGSNYVGNVTMKIQVPSSMALSSPSINGTVQELEVTIPGSEFYQLTPPNYISNKTAAASKPSYHLPMRPASGRLVFGRSFLRSMYLVVDYDKGEFYLGPSAWRERGTQDLAPIVSSWWETKKPGGKSKSHVGAIVGGVLGGIAAVLILAGIVYWWRRKHEDSGDGSPTTYAQQYQKDGQQQMSGFQGGYSGVQGNSLAQIAGRGELEA